MGLGFREFIQKLAIWEDAKEWEQDKILAAIEKIPKSAAECFEAQYFELARQYEDFAIWANLQEHKKTYALMGDLSEYVQQYIALSKIGKSAMISDLRNSMKLSSAYPKLSKLPKQKILLRALDGTMTHGLTKQLLRRKTR